MLWRGVLVVCPRARRRVCVSVCLSEHFGTADWGTCVHLCMPACACPRARARASVRTSASHPRVRVRVSVLVPPCGHMCARGRAACLCMDAHVRVSSHRRRVCVCVCVCLCACVCVCLCVCVCVRVGRWVGRWLGRWVGRWLGGWASLIVWGEGVCAEAVASNLGDPSSIGSACKDKHLHQEGIILTKLQLQ